MDSSSKYGSLSLRKPQITRWKPVQASTPEASGNSGLAKFIQRARERHLQADPRTPSARTNEPPEPSSIPIIELERHSIEAEGLEKRPLVSYTPKSLLQICTDYFLLPLSEQITTKALPDTRSWESIRAQIVQAAVRQTKEDILFLRYFIGQAHRFLKRGHANPLPFNQEINELLENFRQTTEVVDNELKLTDRIQNFADLFCKIAKCCQKIYTERPHANNSASFYYKMFVNEENNDLLRDGLGDDHLLNAKESPLDRTDYFESLMIDILDAFAKLKPPDTRFLLKQISNESRANLQRAIDRQLKIKSPDHQQLECLKNLIAEIESLPNSAQKQASTSAVYSAN